MSPDRHTGQMEYVFGSFAPFGPVAGDGYYRAEDLQLELCLLPVGAQRIERLGAVFWCAGPGYYPDEAHSQRTRPQQTPDVAPQIK